MCRIGEVGGRLRDHAVHPHARHDHVVHDLESQAAEIEKEQCYPC
jgi:hypothetical protein